MKDLLLGFVANRARVVEDQSGFLHRGYLTVSLGEECADNFFRIMHSHLAAEDFQVERFLRFSRHHDSSITHAAPAFVVGPATLPAPSCVRAVVFSTIESVRKPCLVSHSPLQSTVNQFVSS